MKSIKVSVVIVNYNTGKLLAECLASIKNGTDNFSTPRSEVIIIDNASNDKSLSNMDVKGKDINVIRNIKNVGFAKAVNQGIEIAKGEYIFLLNPDCRLVGNVLDKLIDYAQNNNEIGVVAPKLLNSDKTVQTSVIPFPTITKAILEFWFRLKVYSKYAPKQTFPIVVESAVMAAFLITPEALKRVGRLNEKYFMYFEDIDYCFKVNKVGLKVIYYPDSEVIHHHGVSGKNLAGNNDQWKRLIPSSKLYHGFLKHYIINFIIWFGTRILYRNY